MKGDLEGRYDVLFYQPERIYFYKKLRENNSFKKLKTLIKEGSYGILPPGDSYDENHPITFIRATEMKEDFEIDFKNAYKVEEQYYKSKRCRLLKNDILIAVKGATIASPKSVVYVEESIENTIINGSIFRIQSNEKAIPKYLAYMLSSEVSKKQMKYSLVANNAVDYLDKQLIENLLVYLPSLETQQNIINIFESAYAEKKAKEAEAKALLNGIDGYLVEELGIVLPEKQENSLKNRVFIRNINEVSGGRFDPNFYSSEFYKLVNSLKKTNSVHLKKVVGFASESWNQQDYFDDIFPYIEISEIDISYGKVNNVVFLNKQEAPSRAKMIVRENDIIVSTTRPSRGAIAKISSLENMSIASTGFAVLRYFHGANRDYIHSILRHQICLNQMVQRSSGGNYPAITQEELSNIQIPLPPLEIQEKIVAEITARREQAKRLQIEAKELLEKAKIEVERMILGGDGDD